MVYLRKLWFALHAKDTVLYIYIQKILLKYPPLNKQITIFCYDFTIFNQKNIIHVYLKTKYIESFTTIYSTLISLFCMCRFFYGDCSLVCVIQGQRLPWSVEEWWAHTPFNRVVVLIYSCISRSSSNHILL